MTFVRTKHLPIFLLLAACVSCTAPPTESGLSTLPMAQTACRNRYRFSGFSVCIPTDSQWSFRFNEQTSVKALFRRGPMTVTHSFYATVTLDAIDPDLPFDQAVKNSHTLITDRSRFTLLEYSQQADGSRGIPCVRFSFRALDERARFAPGVPLHLVTKGLTCAHPSMKGSAVEAVYSERGLPSELDPSLWLDLEEFLRGVQIESASGMPTP